MTKSIAIDGCEHADHCLACPLPNCIYDQAYATRSIRRLQRNNNIVNLRNKDGLTITKIADTVGLSPRTIYRILARGRG